MPVPYIFPNSITGITGLERRPVYFLKLNNEMQPSIVVKGDAINRDEHRDDDMISIQWGSKLMKNVNNDPQVNVKILEHTELTEFKRAALTTFDRNSNKWLNAFGEDPNNPQLKASYIWIKMPYVDGLSDADFAEDNTAGFIQVMKNIKLLIPKFSNDQVWFDLGKIVAVDIFNGNNDRFNITTGNWQNFGNIMFLPLGHANKVIGLDAFDPNSAESNLNTGGAYNALNVLKDDPGARIARRDFAHKCVVSVGQKIKEELLRDANVNTKRRQTGAQSTLSIKCVGPNGPEIRVIEVNSMEELFVPYQDEFSRGLETGADGLKTYLLRKLEQYGTNRPLPNGVRLRMEHLAWIVPDRPAVQIPNLPFRPKQPNVQVNRGNNFLGGQRG